MRLKNRIKNKGKRVQNFHHRKTICRTIYRKAFKKSTLSLINLKQLLNLLSLRTEMEQRVQVAMIRVVKDRTCDTQVIVRTESV